MIKKIQLAFLLLIICIISVSCTSNDKDAFARIQVKIPSKAEAKLELIKFEMIYYDEIIIDSVLLDRSGEGQLNMATKDATWASIKVNENYHPIFIKPGFDIKLEWNTNADKEVLHFIGMGSLENNYLAFVHASVTDFYTQNPDWYRSSPEYFSSKIEDLRKRYDSLLQNYKVENELSEESHDLFESYQRILLLNLKQQHYLINQQSYPKHEVPVALNHRNSDSPTNDHPSQMPIDSKFLDMRMLDYAQVLDLYLRMEVEEPLIAEIALGNKDSLSNYLPVLARERIKNLNFPEGINEYLLAKDISFWLSTEGISAGIDSVYKDYIEEYKTSAYTRAIEKQYTEWSTLKRGQPAPEIIGLTVDNDTVRLSQFKGKVVYIDVWASWCAPCKEEFPYYKNIQEKFSGNNEVEFLFVSVDKDRSKWAQFLAEKEIPEGIHINEPNEMDKASIQDSYKMWGVPRYILIDREGNIVVAKAARPSSGKVAELIEGSLKIKRKK